MTINDVIMDIIGDRYCHSCKTEVLNVANEILFSGTLGELSANLRMCATQVIDPNIPYAFVNQCIIFKVK